MPFLGDRPTRPSAPPCIERCLVSQYRHGSRCSPSSPHCSPLFQRPFPAVLSPIHLHRKPVRGDSKLLLLPVSYHLTYCTVTSHRISQQSLGDNASALQETYVDCRSAHVCLSVAQCHRQALFGSIILGGEEMRERRGRY